MRPERWLVVWWVATWCGGAFAGDEPEAPDLAFLEYLGGLVEQEGEWVGPDDMMVVRDERTGGVAERPDPEQRVEDSP